MFCNKLDLFQIHKVILIAGLFFLNNIIVTLDTWRSILVLLTCFRNRRFDTWLWYGAEGILWFLFLIYLRMLLIFLFWLKTSEEFNGLDCFLLIICCRVPIVWKYYLLLWLLVSCIFIQFMSRLFNISWNIMINLYFIDSLSLFLSICRSDICRLFLLISML
mgnify:CR=1 FL=1